MLVKNGIERLLFSRVLEDVQNLKESFEPIDRQMDFFKHYELLKKEAALLFQTLGLKRKPEFRHLLCTLG